MGWRAVEMTSRLLVEFLCSGSHPRACFVRDGLPPTARLVAARFDRQRDVVTAVLEDPSWVGPEWGGTLPIARIWMDLPDYLLKPQVHIVLEPSASEDQTFVEITRAIHEAYPDRAEVIIQRMAKWRYDAASWTHLDKMREDLRTRRRRLARSIDEDDPLG